MADMIWNAIIDHIPIWGWVLIIGIPIGALLYFFSPILIPIWNALPKWLKVTLIFIGGVFLAFMGGRYRGRANAEDEERRRNAQALQKRNEVDRDVDNKSNSQVDKDLRDRWQRD
jgi:membrane protein implicated in regulation of membrane protease activity